MKLHPALQCGRPCVGTETCRVHGCPHCFVGHNGPGWCVDCDRIVAAPRPLLEELERPAVGEDQPPVGAPDYATAAGGPQLLRSPYSEEANRWLAEVHSAEARLLYGCCSVDPVRLCLTCWSPPADLVFVRQAIPHLYGALELDHPRPAEANVLARRRAMEGPAL